ncbi:alpha/beta hydrolase [Levilactobacillus bambusae]|uniref:Acyltransferase n=1 Tax=Levilactobacillus bambusae TaxID=2024736 RepID=A0A2V1MYI6_9LACO|nr:alpha/beta hydrolase [Levilactobacillus bambusae]PWG00074.1 acyltransferase [Levilactobacillus bambusae]
MIKKRYGWWLLLFGLCVLLFLPGYLTLSKQTEAFKTSKKTYMAPLIMVPGSSATPNRYDGLVTELNKKTTVKHSLLRVLVKTDGQLKFSGKIRARDPQPIIVVGFENSADGEQNIYQQAKWFNIAFKRLQSVYQFNHFSALGHSNGGLILTLFMEENLSKYNVTADRLMAIGSPFNMEEKDRNVKTGMYNTLYKQRLYLPSSLTVYSVAGGTSLKSDGIVPDSSVALGRNVFQGSVKHYTEITVTGSTSNHADLPENPQIIKLMEQYLLTGKPKSSSKPN